MKSTVVALSLSAVFVAALAGFGLGSSLPEGSVDWKPIDEPESDRPATLGDMDQLRREVTEIRRALPEGIAAIEVPEEATLFGQRVPLDRPEIREAVAYELVLTAGRPLMPLLWMRRAPVSLAIIEERLAKTDLPSDLKYIALIESDLRWRITSPAGAEGLWQFMRATAQRYDLTIDRYLDERRDPEKATDAALRHLEDLHESFGDWFLAAAAYNAGEKRVSDAIEEQNERSYFDLYLPRETRRYVPRILAAKLVMESPETFGLVRMRPLHVPTYRHVEVEVRGSRADLRELAVEHGLAYASLRVANPQLRGSYLPRGTHTLRVPYSPDPPES